MSNTRGERDDDKDIKQQKEEEYLREKKTNNKQEREDEKAFVALSHTLSVSNSSLEHFERRLR